MTILITGASGFIGRHLCARLTAENHRVLALMRRPTQSLELRQRVAALGGKGELLTALAGDLDRPALGLEESLPQLDAVVHLGARFGWNLDADAARLTNVTGSLAAAELARQQGCRLVFVSGFMLENHSHLLRLGIDIHDLRQTDWRRVYRRAGAYEASKLEAGLRVRAFANAHGLDWVEMQPATVAGHRVTGELDPAQPLFTLIDNLAKGRLAMVPGSREHWLPLVAVDHLAALIARAAVAEQPPPRLLALDPATPALQGLLALLASELGRKAPRRHVPMPILAALLRIPGLPTLMNTAPEALHFIQPTRFRTADTETFMTEQRLRRPAIQEVIRASARYYARCQSVGAAHDREVEAYR